jgi:hypothetical protein
LDVDLLGYEIEGAGRPKLSVRRGTWAFQWLEFVPEEPSKSRLDFSTLEYRLELLINALKAVSDDKVKRAILREMQVLLAHADQDL